MLAVPETCQKQWDTNKLNIVFLQDGNAKSSALVGFGYGGLGLTMINLNKNDTHFNVCTWDVWVRYITYLASFDV